MRITLESDDLIKLLIEYNRMGAAQEANGDYQTDGSLENQACHDIMELYRKDLQKWDEDAQN